VSAGGGRGDGRTHIVVVGGGITGLAAAYRLSLLAPEVAITLIEADGRLGGKIVTEHVDGFVIEGGPDSFLASKPRGVGLSEELGLAGRLQGTTPQRRRAFVLRHGRLYDLPEGLTGLVPTRLGPMVRSGLISPRGKARLALDYVLPARRDGADESLAAFVRRRLGREVYDHLIEPLMAGIYGGDGERLSLAATFPHLRQGEVKHGGLIRGALATNRPSGTTAPPTSVRTGFLTPENGLDELVAALVRKLRATGVQMILGQAVTSIAIGHRESGYRVAMGTGETLEVDGAIVATPAFAAATILEGMSACLSTELRGIPAVSSAIVSMGFPRARVPHALDGHGYLVPRVEGRAVLACTWTSAKWAGRAPRGWVLLRVFIGRDGQEDVLQGSDDELVGLARHEIQETLRITAEPPVIRVHRWPAGMPQYTLGHLDRLAIIEEELATFPGLALAGSAYRGVGLPDCIASGEASAEVVHAAATERMMQRRKDQGAPRLKATAVGNVGRDLAPTPVHV
jgi:oxygen-dependent protoporphyrinogen oxidase